MRETTGAYRQVKQALGIDASGVVPGSLTIQRTAPVLGVPVSAVRRMIAEKKLRCMPGCRKPMQVTMESIIRQLEGVFV